MGTRALFSFTFLFLFASGGLHFRSLQACILIVVGARRREHSAFEILSHHLRFSSITFIPLCYSCFACSACVYLFLSSFYPLLEFYQTLDQSLQQPSKSFPGFLGLGLSFYPFLFDRDSPLHPNCFECIFMCEPEIEFLAFLAFLCLTQPRWCPLWLFIYQSLLLNSSKTTFSLSISSAWSSV
jgi:hypothetical protein